MSTLSALRMTDGAADHQLADAAGAKAAADHDPLGVLPALRS